MANEVDLSELERYLRIFQENPDSRVFAPLADLYRRLGRLKEAEEICREGISRHPYYAGGRVALAHVLLDSGRLEDCLAEVDNVVTYYPDNLLARKILIRALGGLGRVDRAQREYEALKALAPLVASDPDIERALQGPRSPRKLPVDLATPPPPPAPAAVAEEPVAPAFPPEMPLAAPPREIFKPMELQEKTEWGEPPAPSSPAWSAEATEALARSQRLARLFRRKLALESLIQALGQP